MNTIWRELHSVAVVTSIAIELPHWSISLSRPLLVRDWFRSGSWKGDWPGEVQRESVVSKKGVRAGYATSL